MAVISLLNAVALTAAEQQSGYTAGANATKGGPDVAGILTSAVANLNEAITQITLIQTVMPAGTNKTNIATALAALSA